DLIKDDFGLDYSRVASTYDDYVTAWILVKNDIKILLTNEVVTYHKHRLSLKDYFRQISRSGQSAALLLKFYPDNPFSKRRLLQVFSLLVAILTATLLCLVLVMAGISPLI